MSQEWSTPDLCDAHPDRVRVVSGIDWKCFGGRARFSGPIRTVKCFEDNSKIKEVLAEPGNGHVLVVDGGGSRRHALIGDMIADRARNQGWEGIIINGACRDVEVLAKLDFGVFAIDRVPCKSVRRGEGQLDCSLSLGGVTVSPEEYVYADDNGVIFSSVSLQDLS